MLKIRNTLFLLHRGVMASLYSLIFYSIAYKNIFFLRVPEMESHCHPLITSQYYVRKCKKMIFDAIDKDKLSSVPEKYEQVCLINN